MSALVWIVFFFLRLPSLFEPYWYGDEGVYLVLGQGIRHGLTLFSQIHDNKPPTLYYLAALSQTVFGFRLLLFLWMIPTVILFYRLSLRHLPPKRAKYALILFIILTSIPTIEGNIANAEIFMLLPTIAAFLFFPSRLVISGLLLGFAFTIKVPVAIEFFFLLCWYFFTQKDGSKLIKLIKFIISFFIPILIYYLYFLFKKSGPEFIFAALLNNFGYLGSWATGTHQSSPASGGLIWRLFLMLLVWGVLYFLYIKKNIDKKIFFVSGWFIATLFGSLLSGRPYPHYLIQVLPPLILLLFFAVKQKLVVITAVILLTFSILKYKFYFYRTLPYYYNFIKFATKKESVSDYRSYFGTNINHVYQLASEIKEKTSPSDSIFIWADQPYLYPLSNRLPASKFVVAYHIIDFNTYDYVYNQLTIKQPRVIIYDSSMSSRPYPQLDSLIGNYYYLEDQVGPYYLFLLRQ